VSFWSRGCLLVGEYYACRWQLVVAESARSFGFASFYAVIVESMRRLNCVVQLVFLLLLGSKCDVKPVFAMFTEG